MVGDIIKRLVFIGAADSIGVPYSRDNNKHMGFFEMIEHRLALDYNLITINCFHMSTNNDNNYINNLITKSFSLEEIKNSQNKMLKKCKYSGIYPYLEMPKNFLNHYQVVAGDNNIIIKDAIRENETIFIYSALVNDLLKSKHLSLFKLLGPGRIKEELKNINVDFVFKRIKNNIDILIKLNPDIKIYIIGLFVPTKIAYIRSNIGEFIYMINNCLKKITDKYENVILVDNSNLSKDDFNNIDFHPNKRGHEKIYNNFIRVYENNLTN